MTVKEIAKAVGKDPATVSRWVLAVSCKMQEVSCKMQEAKQTKIAANYDLNEACQIIEEGMGKDVADTFRTNAVHAEMEVKQTARKAKLPSGAQLREMRLGLPKEDFRNMVAFMIGYSSKPKVTVQIEDRGKDVPLELGMYLFDEMKRKYGGKNEIS